MAAEIINPEARQQQLRDKIRQVLGASRMLTGDRLNLLAGKIASSLSPDTLPSDINVSMLLSGPAQRAAAEILSKEEIDRARGQLPPDAILNGQVNSNSGAWFAGLAALPAGYGPRLEGESAAQYAERERSESDRWNGYLEKTSRADSSAAGAAIAAAAIQTAFMASAAYAYGDVLAPNAYNTGNQNNNYASVPEANHFQSSRAEESAPARSALPPLRETEAAAPRRTTLPPPAIENPLARRSEIPREAKPPRSQPSPEEILRRALEGRKPNFSTPVPNKLPGTHGAPQTPVPGESTHSAIPTPPPAGPEGPPGATAVRDPSRKIIGWVHKDGTFEVIIDTPPSLSRGAPKSSEKEKIPAQQASPGETPGTEPKSAAPEPAPRPAAQNPPHAAPPETTPAPAPIKENAAPFEMGDFKLPEKWKLAAQPMEGGVLPAIIPPETLSDQRKIVLDFDGKVISRESAIAAKIDLDTIRLGEEAQNFLKKHNITLPEKPLAPTQRAETSRPARPVENPHPSAPHPSAPHPPAPRPVEPQTPSSEKTVPVPEEKTAPHPPENRPEAIAPDSGKEPSAPAEPEKGEDKKHDDKKRQASSAFEAPVEVPHEIPHSNARVAAATAAALTAEAAPGVIVENSAAAPASRAPGTPALAAHGLGAGALGWGVYEHFAHLQGEAGRLKAQGGVTADLGKAAEYSNIGSLATGAASMFKYSNVLGGASAIAGIGSGVLLTGSYISEMNKLEAQGKHAEALEARNKAAVTGGSTFGAGVAMGGAYLLGAGMLTTLAVPVAGGLAGGYAAKGLVEMGDQTRVRLDQRWIDYGDGMAAKLIDRVATGQGRVDPHLAGVAQLKDETARLAEENKLWQGDGLVVPELDKKLAEKTQELKKEARNVVSPHVIDAGVTPESAKKSFNMRLKHMEQDKALIRNLKPAEEREKNRLVSGALLDAEKIKEADRAVKAAELKAKDVAAAPQLRTYAALPGAMPDIMKSAMLNAGLQPGEAPEEKTAKADAPKEKAAERTGYGAIKTRGGYTYSATRAEAEKAKAQLEKKAAESTPLAAVPGEGKPGTEAKPQATTPMLMGAIASRAPTIISAQDGAANKTDPAKAKPEEQKVAAKPGGAAPVA